MATWTLSLEQDDGKERRWRWKERKIEQRSTSEQTLRKLPERSSINKQDLSSRFIFPPDLKGNKCSAQNGIKALKIPGN